MTSELVSLIAIGFHFEWLCFKNIYGITIDLIPPWSLWCIHYFNAQMCFQHINSTMNDLNSIFLYQLFSFNLCYFLLNMQFLTNPTKIWLLMVFFLYRTYSRFIVRFGLRFIELKDVHIIVGMIKLWLYSLLISIRSKWGRVEYR